MSRYAEQMRFIHDDSIHGRIRRSLEGDFTGPADWLFCVLINLCFPPSKCRNLYLIVKQLTPYFLTQVQTMKSTEIALGFLRCDR